MESELADRDNHVEPSIQTVAHRMMVSAGFCRFFTFAIVPAGLWLQVLRAIPSVVDGFKPVQRKIMWASFKRNLKSDPSSENRYGLRMLWDLASEKWSHHADRQGHEGGSIGRQSAYRGLHPPNAHRLQVSAG